MLGLGAKKALPIVLGYIPIGFAYGVLSREVGLTLLETVMMSVLVYAGSSQFIAVNLLGRGADPVSIIFTTFLVNLRHMLMSASLALYFKNYPRKILPALAFGITDETYAINAVELKAYDKDYNFVLGLHLTAYVAWLIGSALGGLFYRFIYDIEALGLDFVLYAMFIFLLMIQLRNKKLVLIGLVSAKLALLFNHLYPGNNWYIIVSTLIAASIGLIIDRGFDFYNGKGNFHKKANKNRRR